MRVPLRMRLPFPLRQRLWYPEPERQPEPEAVCRRPRTEADGGDRMSESAAGLGCLCTHECAQR